MNLNICLGYQCYNKIEKFGDFCSNEECQKQLLTAKNLSIIDNSFAWNSHSYAHASEHNINEVRSIISTTSNTFNGNLLTSSEQNDKDYNLKIQKHIIDKMCYIKDCGKFFIDKDTRDIHIEEVHKDKKLLFCNICSIPFFYKSKLDEHKIKHTKEKPFKCIKCNDGFGIKFNLTRHLLSVHNINNLTGFQCIKCRDNGIHSIFSKKYNLYIHNKRVHANIPN